MTKRNLIFDFDGVIGDTFDMNWEITNFLHPEVEKIRFQIDHHLGNVFENPVVPFTKDSTEEFYKLYNNKLNLLHIKDSLPCLKKLSKKYNLYIVTSNCEHAIRRVLKDAGVDTYFKHILGQEAHASKVEKFKSLAKTDNLVLQDTYFITDTLGDLLEAEKVSLKSIAITFGYHPEEILNKGKSIATLHSWEEVESFLEF